MSAIIINEIENPESMCALEFLTTIMRDKLIKFKDIEYKSILNFEIIYHVYRNKLS